MAKSYVIGERGVVALRNLLRKGEATGTTYGPNAVAQDTYAAPFTVRWSQSQNDGDGCWIIWLPVYGNNAGDKLLLVGNQYVDILEGTGELTAATGYPTGWYQLANNATGGAVYLTVLRPLSGASSSRVVASIVTAPVNGGGGESEGYYHRYNILIAEMATEANTGFKRVKQYIDSTIQIGDYGSRHPDGPDAWEDDEGGMPHTFDIAEGKVVRCYAPAPCGAMVVGADYTINAQLGNIYVHLDKTTSGGVDRWSLSVDQVSRAESQSHHEWTLYEYANGAVTCDCRPRVLPIVDWDGKSIEQDATKHKVQIKGWDSATPAASTSVAQSIRGGLSTEKVIVRTNSGELEYKAIGTLAQLLNSSVSRTGQKILTGLMWDSTQHVLKFSSATVDIDHGVITSWTTNANETISTTPISSII